MTIKPSRTNINVTNDAQYETRASLATATVSSTVLFVRTSGYTTRGDGGGALYVRAGTEPAHALKVQSADGAWWELVPDPAGVSVRQAGATGDGTTDDATAIQNAIDAGLSQTIIFPDGTYLIGTTLVSAVGGQRFIGSAKINGPIIKANAALAHMFRVSHQGGLVSSINFDANGTASDCLGLHNIGAGVVENVKTEGYTRYGIRFDNDLTATPGNNNGAILRGVTCNGAGGGVAGIAVPTAQGDNNDIIVEGTQSTNHSAQGMLVKGHAWRVYGGNYFANDKGIQVGDTVADGTNFSTGHLFLNAWIESNTTAGIELNKALRTTVFHPSVAGMDKVVDSDGRNVVLTSNTGGSVGELRVQTGSDSRWLQVNSNGLSQAGGTDTNRDMTLTPKGTGKVVSGTSFLAQGGSVSEPSFSVGSTGTGISEPVSGNLGVSLAGAEKYRFKADRLVPLNQRPALGSSSNTWGDAYFADATSLTVVMKNLPTADPVNAGQLWNDAGTVKVSAG